jgi:hypothetical protein
VSKLAAAALAVLLGGSSAAAQPAGPVTTMQCGGVINGVASQALVQIERVHAGTQFQRSFVTGVIQNPNAHYTFQGELFGATEGFISMTERRTGERIDRVYIGAAPGGFMIRAENSAPHTFRCQ